MYNRYIRSDDGTYQRIPRQTQEPQEEHHRDHWDPPPSQEPQESQKDRSEESGGFLRRILDKLNLKDVDTGDILLLLLLLFLFSEGEDEELLFAVGLLLIL